MGPVCKLLWAPKHKVGMGSHQDYLYILCWQQLEAATDYHYQPLWRDLIWHSYSSYNTLHYSCSQMNWFLMNWLLNLGGVYSNGNLVMAFFTSYVNAGFGFRKGIAIFYLDKLNFKVILWGFFHERSDLKNTQYGF